MRCIRRLGAMNFWYDVALKTTIWKTLKETTGFDSGSIRVVKKRYARLCAENRRFIDDIASEYHLSWSAAILAIYEACLAAGFDRPRAIAATRDTVFRNMRSDSVAAAVGRSLDRAGDPFRFMVDASKSQERRFFGSAFSFRRVRDDGDAYRLRVGRCFYFDFFKANGAPELMAVACAWDLVSWSAGIVPARHGFSFSRPVTLGLDGADCEFDFVRARDRG